MLSSVCRLVLVGLYLCLVLSLPATAQEERITAFRAEIAVEADSSLTVRETIAVVAAGEGIRRGIYRDFPTSYAGTLGLRDEVGFELIGARRDGQAERVQVEGLSNGVRIRLGNPNRLLEPGPHIYEIVYRTDRQLRHFDDVDELYWNVTGNDWEFTIDSVEARIVLPDGAPVRRMTGYTGYAGEAGGDWRATTGSDGTARFSTTRPLAPGEGLTVAVAWPKGYVAVPTQAEALVGGIADNLGLVIAIAGILVVTAYFLVVWHRVGRDPPKGVIIPLFEAPEGLSPVALGYIAHSGFAGGFSRADAFSAALVSLAVKGALTLSEDGKEVTLRRTGDDRPRLSPGEREVMRNLFADGDTITLGGTYDPGVAAAVGTLANVVRHEYTEAYFRSNLGHWLAGAGLALLFALGALLSDARSGDEMLLAVLLTIFAAVFTAAPIMLFRKLWPHLRRVARGRSPRPVANLAGLVFATVFCFPPLLIVAIMSTFVPLPVVVAVGVMIVMTLVFLALLRAPTMHGRKVLDAIEGYRLYLSVAEEDRLALAADEPEMTVERFETHLPCAMALGVAEAWTEKFARRVDLTRPGGRVQDYRPRWYGTSSGFASPSQLAGHLSQTLSSTVASASTAPSSSSSSASGGGGSSGGGGGGGGGGGW